MAQGQTEPAKSTPTRRVEFVGVAPYGREFHSDRIISAADFKRVGIEDAKMTSWNPNNGFIAEVPVSEAALAYFGNPENGFKVLD